MFLRLHYGTIPLLPNGLLFEQLFRKALIAESLRMHANYENLFIIGTIEDTNPPALRQPAGRAPKKIVLKFLCSRLLETENLTALRIDTGHDMPDGAVLARSIHSLKNQQQGIMVGRVVELLQRTQLLNMHSIIGSAVSEPPSRSLPKCVARLERATH